MTLYTILNSIKTSVYFRRNVNYKVLRLIVEKVWFPPPDPRVRNENVREIKRAIDRFYADHGRYPRELSELANDKYPYFAELPKNPFTGKADWEVRERYLPERWYSSPDLETNYPGSPGIKWSPGPESGIYDVRPRVKMIR